MIFNRPSYHFQFLVFLSLIFGHDSHSQILDTSAYRQIHYVQTDVANDLFTVFYQSDKYFSDGLHVEWADDLFKNKVSNAALLGFRGTTFKDFSLSIEQDMFTPENTKLTTVDSTDRPYAGQLFLTYSKFSNRFWKGQKLSTRLYFGVQGPAALAEQVQNGVHGAIGNDEVLGWDNQLSNGLILDYQVDYLGLLPISTAFSEFHYFGKARAGLLNTFADVGLRFKTGHYTDTYVNRYGIYNPKYKHNFSAKEVEQMSSSRRQMIPKKIRRKGFEEQAKYLNKKLNRKFQCYGFIEGFATYYLRNGSVEGSLLQFQPNVYELSYDDYNHFYLGGRYGFVVQYANVELEYLRILHTDTYRESGYFGYGKLVFSWVF